MGSGRAGLSCWGHAACVLCTLNLLLSLAAAAPHTRSLATKQSSSRRQHSSNSARASDSPPAEPLPPAPSLDAIHGALFARLDAPEPELRQQLQRLVFNPQTLPPTSPPDALQLAAEVALLAALPAASGPSADSALLASLLRIHLALRRLLQASSVPASAPGEASTASIAPLSSSTFAGLRRAVIGALVWQRHQASRQATELPVHAPHQSDPAALVRGEGDVWSPEVQAAVWAVCSDLSALHVAGAAHKAAVEFLHISKSGGTSMCAAARLNSCSAHRNLRLNCKMPSFHDLPRWVSPEGHSATGEMPSPKAAPWWLTQDGPRLPQTDSCAARAATMRSGGLNFYSNEFTAHTTTPAAAAASSAAAAAVTAAAAAAALPGSGAGGGLGGVVQLVSIAEGPLVSGAEGEGAGAAAAPAHVCGQFLNAVLLRRPARRLESHVKAIIRLYQSTARIAGKRGAEWVQGPRNASYWQTLAPFAVDNLYLRSLLGPAVFDLPIGALTPAHVGAARTLLLEHFDVLLVLEQPAISTFVMQVGLGWNRRLPHANEGRQGGGGAAAAAQRAMPRDFQTLVTANALDEDVYEWAAMLQRLDTFAFAVAAMAAPSPQQAAAAAAAAAAPETAVDGRRLRRMGAAGVLSVAPAAAVSPRQTAESVVRALSLAVEARAQAPDKKGAAGAGHRRRRAASSRGLAGGLGPARRGRGGSSCGLVNQAPV